MFFIIMTAKARVQSYGRTSFVVEHPYNCQYNFLLIALRKGDLIPQQYTYYRGSVCLCLSIVRFLIFTVVYFVILVALLGGLEYSLST